jgi:hypothetical protein
MPYSSFLSCDDTLDPHFCAGCDDNPDEHGRIRRGAFVHTSVFAAIAADPSNATLWNTHIAAGKIIILPELQGTFDGGTPKLVAGFGDLKERYSGSDFKSTIKDPVYKKNWAFYRSIVGKQTWHYYFCTENFGHLTSKPVTVAPKNPITENVDDVVIWEADISWFENFSPAPHDIPDVFACVNPDDSTGTACADKTFDTIIDPTTTGATSDGVTATVGTDDPDIRLEFNKITTRTGTPNSMTIKVATVDALVVDFTSDYVTAAKEFRFTDASGAKHCGTFTNGTVNF